MLTSRKIKAHMRKLDPGFECHVQPIRINGTVRGASGFILNAGNGKIMYINTESSCYGPLRDKVLYREARSLTDYVGGRNQWAGEDEVLGLIHDALS
ncbi:hypothetical protein [Enterocloster citroniae]|nr:hypothetical protein [Enterocloster citroniae]